MAGFWKKDIGLWLVALLVCLVLLWGDKGGYLNLPRGFLERPFLAVEERLYSLTSSFHQFLASFTSRQKTEQELMRLQGQLAQLAFDQSRLSVCEEENQAMRKLLGAPLPAEWQFLPAEVLGTSQGLRLNKGKKEGVGEGMMVLTQNVLVGRVKSSETSSCLVERPGEPGVKIPVVVKRPAAGENEAPRAAGGAVGRGLLVSEEGALFVERILQEEDVRANDLVLTAGEAGWLPDLVIGVVEEVTGREAEVYRRARVRSFFEGERLKVVFVVRGH